jgi:XRE family transcriptional regulator, aerobic/anaerobic benzoate catabolism transcriptional regulator
LRATPEEHMKRVLDQGDLRPMADGPQAMDDLKAILESRTPLYAKANAVVSTSGKTESEVLGALLARIPVNSASHASAQVARAGTSR